MTDDHLDDLIDGAVRDLMDVDADGGFRARVIDRVRGGRRARFTTARLAMAGAALAVVAIVSFTIGQRDDPVVPARTTSDSMPQPPSTAAPGPPAAGQAAARTSPREGTGRARPDRAAPERVASDRPDERPPEIAVAPLGELQPIPVAPLEHRPIAIVEISVEPLPPLPRLEVRPLSSQAESNRGES
jgi:hypothetical protein